MVDLNRALREDLQRTIAEMSAVPNLNVQYSFGLAMGKAGAYHATGVIDAIEHKAAVEQIGATHLQLLEILRRTGRDNEILSGEK
jgi:hypothetical protein